MRPRSIAWLLLLAAPAAVAAADPPGDGVWVESAELAQPARTRSGGPRGRIWTSGDGVRGSLLWSGDGAVASGVVTGWEAGGLSQSANVRWQLLSQKTGPVGLSSSFHLRAQGPEGAGPELDARAALGRNFGRLNLVANAQLGKGITQRTDLDLETAAAASFRISQRVQLGLEARLRTELVDQYQTADDVGRAYDLRAGPEASFRLGELQLQALAGWGAPRGPGAAGPLALGLARFDF